jgi:hypothetical protein
MLNTPYGFIPSFEMGVSEPVSLLPPLDEVSS